ncbi:hypothetical protein ACFWIQ_03355 [Kitasatospora sp. NPDC127059]|uniref:hypothetical protein n=1 Tax=unclassified Kitasatospora TaxID=2633591 RepID=UPI00364EEDF7
MAKHRSSTRIATRLASVAVAVGLVLLPQVGASAQAAQPQAGTHQAAGSATGSGDKPRIDEWNGTGAWCVSCVKPKQR